MLVEACGLRCNANLGGHGATTTITGIFIVLNVDPSLLLNMLLSLIGDNTIFLPLYMNEYVFAIPRCSTTKSYSKGLPNIIHATSIRMTPH